MSRGALVRDLGALGALAVVLRAAAALLVPDAPYVDAAYTGAMAGRLAAGDGFTAPFIWSFLETGAMLPSDGSLPVPSHGHWMPLPAVVGALGVLLLGDPWRGAQLANVLLAAALVPLTYLVAVDLWRSRRVAWTAALLAVGAGPMAVLAPLPESFAVFGLAAAGAVWASVRSVGAGRPGPLLALAGVLVGVATLARIDGVLVAAAPAVAWAIRLRDRPLPGHLLAGIGSAAGFGLVVLPWLVRNAATFGSALPSTGGHTLWITSYNEQFSLAADPGPASYLAWGIGNILASKLAAWGELVGRTTVLVGGVFIVGLAAGLWAARHRRELRPLLAYLAVMFLAMGGIFTFHAPKGAFYHSAWAWLPFALPMAVAGMEPAAMAAGRWWPFLRRPRARRFLVGAGLGGAAVLSLAGSAILLLEWRVADRQLDAAAAFLTEHGAGDRALAYDAPGLWLRSGIESVAPPFDPYPVVGEVIDRYGIDWLVVTLRPGEAVDPLGLWAGSEAVDIEGNRPSFIDAPPAFEAPGVRIFAVGVDTPP